MIKVEDLKPGQIVRTMGVNKMVACAPRFWRGHNQGKGYVVVETHDEQAEILVIYKGEQIQVVT